MDSWLISAILFACAVPLTGQTTVVHTSPDGAVRAIVTTDAAGESQVQFQAAPQRVLLKRDERSQDHEHGHGIAHAAWTPDSHFCVVSTVATGGHQPWARPMWVYSRAGNRVIELWKLGVVATGDFALKPPDIVATKIDCNAKNRPLAFSLHDLISAGRLPIEPCPARPGRRESGPVR
jgi:hypothetical protein